VGLGCKTGRFCSISMLVILYKSEFKQKEVMQRTTISLPLVLGQVDSYWAAIATGAELSRLHKSGAVRLVTVSTGQAPAEYTAPWRSERHFDMSARWLLHHRRGWWRRSARKLPGKANRVQVKLEQKSDKCCVCFQATAHRRPICIWSSALSPSAPPFFIFPYPNHDEDRVR